MADDIPTTDIQQKKMSRLQRAIDFLNQACDALSLNEDDEETAEGEK